MKIAAKFQDLFLQEDDLAFNPSVNIIFGADGIKHYFAKRSNVQEALEGLCYMVFRMGVMMNRMKCPLKSAQEWIIYNYF